MRTTLTGLVHGESGIGKSWFADTVPAPRLILDAEGRAKYTPSGPKVWWDPRAGGPPMYDGTWETCVVSVTDFEVIRLAHQWLRSGQHSFVSVVLDSVMEAQKRCIDAIAGVNALDQQDWGTLLRNVEGEIRKYRDLTMLPDDTQTTSVVIMVSGSRENKGKQMPLLQGQIADTLPYYLDLVGYLYRAPVTAADGSTAYQRQLLIDKQPGFDAKDNTGKLVRALGPVVPIGDDQFAGYGIADLMAVMNQSEAVATAATA